MSAVHDVVVVGGGVAGWSAARRAQQLGARVVLLDKAEGDNVSSGNTVLSGGVFHASYCDPHRSPTELEQLIVDRTEGATRPELARAWAENVGRARDFLEAEGGNFVRAGDEEYLWNVLSPRAIDVATGGWRNIVGSGVWSGMGPDLLLRTMHAALLAGGGAFRGGLRATALTFGTDGAVDGIVAESSNGGRTAVRGRTVVLADGGFHSNAHLVRCHITSAYRVRGTQSDQGDGLAMALEAGAVLVNMGAFYGHTVVRDSLWNERLWPQPSPEHLIDAAIVVDATGRRLVDEWRGDAEYASARDQVSWAIARSASPDGCWVVFDSVAWDTVGRNERRLPMNPVLVEEGGTLAYAPTIAELASSIGVDAANLRTSVAAFNDYARFGVPIDPPRSGRPAPIERGPFFAIPLIVGITFAMGGPLVDARGAVLDELERPITGLYAAGGTMGGLQGGPRNGYAGGWSEAATFGLLSGEHAARSALLSADEGHASRVTERE